MKDMEQSNHIESLISASNERSRQVNKIQSLYEEYVATLSEFTFNELIRLLDSFALSWVRTHLQIAECYSDDNLDIVMQDARLGVYNAARNKSGQQLNKPFAYYAFGIYKIKTKDLIRNVVDQRSKLPTVPLDGQPGQDGGKEPGDNPPGPVNPVEDKEKRRVYAGVFRLYCSALVNAESFPPMCLALFYARILPHLFSEIPDTKAASAKWAFERMGKLTVLELTQDSETTLQSYIDNSLTWCVYYMEQLEKELEPLPSKDRLRLKDIVYTSEYNKDKIEDWSEHMHKRTVKHAIKYLYADKELLELVMEYAASSQTLQKFLKGKGGNHR